MLKEFFESTSDFVKSRVTNPFLGTMLAVWLIRNFEFIYALFNFAEGVTLTQKEDYIRRYFNEYGTIAHFLQNIFISIGLLVLGFVFLLLTRAATNGYSVALNWLNSKTDKGSVVSRMEFEGLQNQAKIIKSERDQLRTEVSLHDQLVKEKNEMYTVLYNEKISLDQKLGALTEDLSISRKDEASKSEMVDELSDEKESLKAEITELESLQTVDAGITQILTDENKNLKLELENLRAEIQNSQLGRALIENLPSSLNNSNLPTSQTPQEEDFEIPTLPDDLINKNVPYWLTQINNTPIFQQNAKNLLHSDLALEFKKSDRALLDLFHDSDILYRYLYYTNYIITNPNSRVHAELILLIPFIQLGLYSYHVSRAVEGELELGNVNISKKGRDVFNYLTSDVLMIQYPEV